MRWQKDYRKALFDAEEVLRHRSLSLNLIKAPHCVLMDGMRGKDKALGEFRKDQNWIRLKDCTQEQARFVPPSPMFL